MTSRTTLRVSGPHGRGTAVRALEAVLRAAGRPGEVRSGLEPAVDLPLLDLGAMQVRVAGRTAAVVLGTPRAGEVGIVEDLLVDRAFADVPGEATALAGLGDLTVETVDELRWQLGAAALARAVGVAADAVRDGLRGCLPDPHGHRHLVTLPADAGGSVAWVEAGPSPSSGISAYDRVVWVVDPATAPDPDDLVRGAPHLRAVVVAAVTTGTGTRWRDLLARHAPDVPVITGVRPETDHVSGPVRVVALARNAAFAGDTVLLTGPDLVAALAQPYPVQTDPARPDHTQPDPARAAQEDRG